MSETTNNHDDVYEELSAKYDELMGDETPEVEEASTPEVEEKVAEEVPEVEAEAPAEEEVVEEQPAEEGADPAEEKPVVKAPTSLKADMQEKFGELSPEWRDEITRINDHALKLVRENADAKNARLLVQDLGNVITPYREILEQSGVPPLVAIDNLFKVENTLRTGSQQAKARMLTQIVNDYGIDLGELQSALVESINAPKPSEAEQRLEQRLADLQQMVRQATQPHAQENQSNVAPPVNNVIEKFVNDSKNEFIKRPGVEDDMVFILDSGKANHIDNLEDRLKFAYDKAIRMNDEIQTELRTRKADQLKRATAGSIQAKGSAPRSKPKTEELSEREMLSRKYDELTGS